MKTAIDPRHQARRLALAKIYSIETVNENEAFLSEDITKKSLNIEKLENDLYKSIVRGVQEKRPELLQKITEHSVGWELSKIFKVDLSILLIATWELMYGKAPTNVVIDESVELAKEFGSSDSKRFINGVLAGITQEINQLK